MKSVPLLAGLAGLLFTATPALAANHHSAPPPRVSAPHPAPQPRPAPRVAPPEHVGRGFVPAVHNLNLSPDQSDRIRGIIESTRQANANADPQTRRDNIAKMRQQIWQTLTPDQREQFKEERSRQVETPSP